jgi:hypothetical protein
MANRPECPQCKSTHVEELGVVRTFDNPASMKLGFLGGLVGKAIAGKLKYECLACGHAFYHNEYWG